ncbi:glycosyltransferase family 2 protein [Rhizobium sullae]|uniref:Succinoglycan biosynthesis protein ExoO n=1 Tax=Rhizobium sullae TaxID=50338 RepID=A0A4R3QBA5_RHISU|nr:glycosyltransferase family 2 protein [Rhizobium sullae]TCU15326.1 succinoglycan biosynthesis protein ExoO [Rhizobium sullae]
MLPDVPDISYIVAAYNAAGTVARAIESVLAQEGVDVEVIVADDCSVDETAHIVRSYGSEKVRLVSLPDNRGPGGARNAAIADARGRWIGIVDADDEILPQRTKRLLTCADVPAVDAVVDNLVIKSEGKERLLHRTADLARLGNLSLAHFIDHNMLFAGRFNLGYLKPLIRRDFIRANGIAYDDQLRIGEDYLFLARTLSRGACCIVEPEAGYLYHSAKGSISHVMNLNDVEAMIRADRDFLATFPVDAAARAAQLRRIKNLEEAAAFLTLVDHIKQRSVADAVKDVLRNPAAARHLKMPITARLKRAMVALQTPSSAFRRVSQ